MPGKHVHFADVPSTPSSTFSNSTLTSSPGPATPPQVLRSPLPVKGGLHAPSQYLPGGVSLNPILAHQLGNGTSMSWNMSEPAESARPHLGSAPSRLTDALVREPATHPALPSLAISCAYLPWTIIVIPTPGAAWSAPYVTVGDVLHTLYRTLRLGVTQHELGAVEPALRERIHASYVSRYRRVAQPAERESEKVKFIKRVDYLCDRTAFSGLSPVPGGIPAKGMAPGSVWALQVTKP
ncbi:hypothetical protein BD309DRAFT_534586 [Dichomitus squalens]|uniref:DUF6699 domain-containing protein n=1 Tax=Dichomitus squalens TaxID=114155 RepID=A0A4Q9Q139_9APHY|nr:hypothetical protein BD309DRAFT_534586 [Dichomitus squalens]TBU60779.1 hypothetical protein BD310DRAFT_266725 [Dichomitus squalens]